MLTIKFAKSAVIHLIDVVSSNSKLSIVLLVCLAVVLLAALYIAVENASKVNGIIPKILYVVIAFPSSVFVLITGAVFLYADGFATLSSEYFVTRFYVEVIIATIIYVPLYFALFFWRYEYYKPKGTEADFGDEEGMELLGVLFRSLAVIIISVICIFSDLETKVTLISFHVFGHNLELGQWAFNAYCAWMISIVLNVVKCVFQLPFQILYGVPIDIMDVSSLDSDNS